MSANFTPSFENYTGQGKFRFWCQTVLPLIYDDSLSYMELLNKMVIYLNNTIQDVAAMETNVDALLTAYNNLQEYVNDYFDNLNVQSEINHKLDVMAEDGSLSTLIQPFIDAGLPGLVSTDLPGVVENQIGGVVASQIGDVVEDQIGGVVATQIPSQVTGWLNENVTPVGSAVVVDSSLTVSGAAADAKVTGRKIKCAENSVIYSLNHKNLSDWEKSSYDTATGAKISSQNYITIDEFFTINDGIDYVECDEGYLFLPRAWDDESNYLGTLQTDGSFSKTGTNYALVSKFFLSEYPNYKMKFPMRLDPTSSSIDVTDGIHFFFCYFTDEELKTKYKAADAKATGDNFNLLSNSMCKNLATSFENGLIHTDGSFGATDTFRSTDYIDVSGMTGVYYTRIHTRSSSTNWCMCFYDASKTAISDAYEYPVVSSSVETSCLSYLAVPSGAKYARFTTYASSVSGFVVYDAEKYISYLKTCANYCCEEEIDFGTLNYTTGGDGFGINSYYPYRKTSKLIKIGDSPVMIELDSSDAELVSSVAIYCYGTVDDALAYKFRKTNITKNGNIIIYSKGLNETTDYIKISLVLTESSTRKFAKCSIRSASKINVVKNIYIENPSYNNAIFTYPVTDGVYTTGQLILPPNYNLENQAVPLWVNVHGTGAMATWDAVMGINGDTDSKYLYEYMANEGFAVFDCYPWTSKYYSASEQISPYAIPLHQQAYIEGIKYVCSHYNVDINNVCLSFKSLGGHLGYWFMTQSYFKPKALAMLAPSTGFASTIWDSYFIRKSARSLIVTILGLENDANASSFINAVYGMSDANAVQFVEDNLEVLVPFICCAIGSHGATYHDQYEWMITGVTTEPQWMVNENIPMWPSDWQSGRASGVPAVINHPELTKYSMYPVKYWQAFDDINTSAHVNYTVYNWLLNGGSDAQWRTLPNNTGGHHAIDTDPNAPKTSGTTRLGIAYTDIATTYVEMANFFYEKMSYDWN